jgi:hypothetical protein
MDDFDAQLPDDLGEIGEQLRASSYAPGAVKMDQLKRRALAQSGAASASGGRLRSSAVRVLLVTGLVVSGGSAAVMAGSEVAKPPAGNTPAKHEYKCNAGHGNDAEQPPTPPSPDCDPGDSASHNQNNEREGP